MLLDLPARRHRQRVDQLEPLGELPPRERAFLEGAHQLRERRRVARGGSGWRRNGSGPRAKGSRPPPGGRARPGAARSSISPGGMGARSVSARLVWGRWGPAELVMLGNSVEP